VRVVILYALSEVESMKLSFLSIAGLALGLAICSAQADEANHWKELTDLKFPGAYPSKEAITRLNAELDFQRAVQVYL
jgi:hypothetical protein